MHLLRLEGGLAPLVLLLVLLLDLVECHLKWVRGLG